MVYCVASNCTSNSVKCSAANGLHFHSFPTDAKRRKVWTLRCRRHESWKPGPKAKLCSKHFSNDAYLRSPDLLKSIGFGSMKLLLKNDAVPTVFARNPSPGTPTVMAQSKKRTTGQWRIQKEALESAYAEYDRTNTQPGLECCISSESLEEAKCDPQPWRVGEDLSEYITEVDVCTTRRQSQVLTGQEMTYAKHFDDTQRELNHPERPLKGDAVPNVFHHTKSVLVRPCSTQRTEAVSSQLWNELDHSYAVRPCSKRRTEAVSSQLWNELDHSYARKSEPDSGTTKDVNEVDGSSAPQIRKLSGRRKSAAQKNKVKIGRIVLADGDEELSRFEGVNADQDQQTGRILRSSEHVDSSMVYIDVAKDADDECVIAGDPLCVGYEEEELMKEGKCEEYKTEEDNTCVGYAKEKSIKYELCEEFIKTEDWDAQELDRDQQNPLTCEGYAEEESVKFEICQEFIKTEVYDDQELDRDQQDPLAIENQCKDETEVCDDQELDRDQQDPLAFENQYKNETEVCDDQELDRNQQDPLAFKNQYEGRDTPVTQPPDPTPVRYCCKSLIGTGSERNEHTCHAQMLKDFSNRDLGIVAICLDEEERNNQKALMKSNRKRKYWVHDAWKKRHEEGEFVTLLPHLLDDETKFFQYFRMPMYTFNQLELKLQEKLSMQDTYFREAISPRHRLAVFLRFLATGDSFQTISFSYRMGRSTVGSIVHHTSRVVIEELLNEVMPVPNEEKWNEVAMEFWQRWQFPNCIGAMDGKHVTIQAPKSSRSLYWNYKKTYSIVLLALVDARYNFIFVDVGSYGRNSDGILSNSNFGKKLFRNQLNIPEKKCLPGTDTKLPMVIVADEAFPLTNNIMRPFPGKNLSEEQRIFNYRLSRARRISENVFGIMVEKFRMFMRPFQGSPNNIAKVILAACILHNFIRSNEDFKMPELTDSTDTTPGGHSRLQDFPRRRGGENRKAFNVREQFKQFFNSENGSV